MAQRHGDTLIFSAPPVIAAHAAVGGKKESRSPLAEGFDELSQDNRLGQKTWEAAEKVLQLRAARLCLQKAGAAERSVNLVLAGDLQAQCTASSYENKFLVLMGRKVGEYHISECRKKNVIYFIGGDDRSSDR